MISNFHTFILSLIDIAEMPLYIKCIHSHGIVYYVSGHCQVWLVAIITMTVAACKDVKVSRTAWPRDHFFGLGLGLGLGLIVIGLGLGLGLI